MTRRRQQHEIEVSIQWLRSRTRGGKTYANLRWRETSPDGTTTRAAETLGYVTQAEADEARARKEASLRLGLVQPDSGRAYAVADLLVDYLEGVELSPTSDGHKDRVAVDCDGLLRHLGHVRVDAITADHTRRYLALRSRERVVRVRRRKRETDADWERRVAAARVDPEGKPISSSTIRHELATLRRAMTWGRDAGRCTAPPIPMPHPKSMADDERPPRRLSEAEVRRLVDAAGEYQGLVEVLAWSGRRPVAIFALRLGDVSRLLEPGLKRSERLVRWRRDKGGHGRGWAPVTEPAYQALRARALELQGQPPDTLLWTTATGKPLSSTSWPHTFAAIAAAAEVEDVVSYDLRKHACAQLLRHLGSPVEAIRYSGHKTVEMFLRVYAYALESAEERAETIGWTPAPLQLLEGGEG